MQGYLKIKGKKIIIFIFRSYLESQGKVGTEDDLLELWDQFQFRAGEEVYKAWGSRPPLILWTSRLTEKGEVDKFLNKEDYIIQIWTGGKNHDFNIWSKEHNNKTNM